MSRNSTAPDQRIEARQERLADLIIDDESLIGDFPEEASEVLVNWAISVTDRLAASTASLDDTAAQLMARDIAKRIESELSFPGQIRVTVVRETRAIEYAK